MNPSPGGFPVISKEKKDNQVPRIDTGVGYLTAVVAPSRTRFPAPEIVVAPESRTTTSAATKSSKKIKSVVLEALQSERIPELTFGEE